LAGDVEEVFFGDDDLRAVADGDGHQGGGVFVEQAGDLAQMVGACFEVTCPDLVADADLFDGERNTAMWRAYAVIPAQAWVEAIDLAGAQVASVEYAPAGWPEDTYAIVRRVRIEADAISADPRSRRRRTIESNQLTLALEGAAIHACAISFIVTNIPANYRPDTTTGTYRHYRHYRHHRDHRGGRSLVPPSRRHRGPHP